MRRSNISPVQLLVTTFVVATSAYLPMAEHVIIAKAALPAANSAVWKLTTSRLSLAPLNAVAVNAVTATAPIVAAPLPLGARAFAILTLGTSQPLALAIIPAIIMALCRKQPRKLLLAGGHAVGALMPPKLSGALMPPPKRKREARLTVNDDNAVRASSATARLVSITAATCLGTTMLSRAAALLLCLACAMCLWLLSVRKDVKATTPMPAVDVAVERVLSTAHALRLPAGVAASGEASAVAGSPPRRRATSPARRGSPSSPKTKSTAARHISRWT